MFGQKPCLSTTLLFWLVLTVLILILKLMSQAIEKVVLVESLDELLALDKLLGALIFKRM
jgi:hypothetical protein